MTPTDADLVGAIYDAALEPSRWRTCLAAFCRAFGAFYGQIGVRHRDRPELSFLTWHGIEDARLQRYIPRYVELADSDWTDARTLDNPAHPTWLSARSTPERLAAIRQGAAYHGDELATNDELATTAVVREVRRPLDLHFGLCVQFDLDERLQGGFALCRGRRGRPFGRNDCDRLDAFAVHLRRGLALHERCAALDHERRAGLAALDSVPAALMIAGADGYLHYANRRACELLDGPVGLEVDLHHLRSGDHTVDAELRTALARAARASLANDDVPPALVHLPAAQGNATMAVILPLRRAGLAELARGADHRALAAVFITPATADTRADHDNWRRHFGLSAAQVRVLGEVVRGGNTQEIAARLGIGVNTVRSHLKALFRATGTHDQAALVRCAVLARAQLQLEQDAS